MAHAAATKTCKQIEGALSSSSAYRKVEDGLYCIKQGTALVMISVHRWRKRAVVRLVAQLVTGVTMEESLGLELLELNGVLRFGAFAFQPAGGVVLLVHTLLDNDLGDTDEFLETIRDFVVVADEYDDRISARYGGQTMQDLMAETAIEQMKRLRGTMKPPPEGS